MTRTIVQSLAVLALALIALLPSARAGFEIREVDPIADGDLHSFEVEGGGEWTLDNQRSLVHTLIVCPKADDDTSLLYRMRKFTDGFQLEFESEGGSRNAGLRLYVVPEKGERIRVPMSQRMLRRDGWHEIILTADKGKAWVRIDDEEAGDPVEVPEDQGLTFAITLEKRSEAAFRRMELKFAIEHEEQRDAEEGFVRIFDGKTLDGWTTLPEGSGFFRVEDQRIVGKLPGQGETRETHLVFADGVFKDYEMRFRASGDSRNLILLGRPGVQGGARAVYTMIEGYFPGDREWNDVTWTVQGTAVALKVNGNPVWSQTAGNEQPMNPRFILTNGGHTTIRDVRIKGENMRPGAAWRRYVKESGGDPGAATPPFGGRGNDPSGESAGGTKVRDEVVLFDGKSLEDWTAMPAGDAWSAVDGKMVGLSYDRPGGRIYYNKLVFEEYRITFKVQKGTTNASWLAKGINSQRSDTPSVTVEFKAEWFGDDTWTEFEMLAMDGKLKVTAGGKQVSMIPIPKEQGVIGFVLKPDGAIGVKDVVMHRSRR